jgi:hypothetical protein
MAGLLTTFMEQTSLSTPTNGSGSMACQRQQQQHWQRGNKVNKDNNNNMTTTEQPTRQPARQPIQRGNRIEWQERNYVFFQCPDMSQPLDSDMPVRPPMLFFWWERYVFMFLYKNIVPVDMA